VIFTAAVVSFRKGAARVTSGAILFEEELVCVGTVAAEIVALRVIVLLSMNDPVADGDDTNVSAVLGVDKGEGLAMPADDG
jgi:hypothetical protein